MAIKVNLLLHRAKLEIVIADKDHEIEYILWFYLLVDYEKAV